MTTQIVLEQESFPIVLINRDQENEHKSVIDTIKSIVVECESSYNLLTSFYHKARDLKKKIEAKRKELVDPYRSEIARINDMAKDLSEPLDQMIEVANNKTGKYVKLLEEAKIKEQEAVNEAAKMFEVEEPQYVAPLEKTVRGDGALAVTKMEKKHRLLDITKVPIKYLILNDAQVKLDIKLGINEIPGLEIYEEAKTTLRTR